MKLCNARTRPGSQRRSFQSRKVLELSNVFDSSTISSIESQVAVIDRFCFTSFVFFNVTAFEDPILSQCRESLTNVTIDTWISPWSASVVNANGRIVTQGSIEVTGWCLGDLAERN